VNKQIIFAITLLITFGVFFYTISRLIKFFRFTRPAFPIKNLRKRFSIMMRVAFGQTKIFRKPVIGFFHALVFWGFCVILIGSIEMVIDGLAGTEKALKFLGPLHDIIMASGDIFAMLVAVSIIVFLSRRIFFHIRRFEGIEMKRRSHLDAAGALTLILLLMISLIMMNIGYLGYREAAGGSIEGIYPVAWILITLIPVPAESSRIIYEVSWWAHILLIFFFANYLPYSKHFHVFMSVPNVFLSRLEPLGKLINMDNITREVKLMLDPAAPASADVPAERFGIKDAEDSTWKNYFDSLSCTECGRCTSVCPANITGKKLSPRKIMMDLRARMKEKGPLMVRSRSLSGGGEFNDNRSLLRDYISEEELWACTTCNACARECPININQPSLIVDMRRYLVLEEASAPGGLKAMFNNIENNGAPWQYSAEDRLNWAKDLEIPVMPDVIARGKKPEYLLWIGCAGAFDDRYKKVVRSFVKILSHLDVSYAVLGKEETCSGDPARRAGNELLYQMQAFQVIGVLKKYEVSRIITVCPHCFNIFRNEYPDLGGNFEVISYLQLLKRYMDDGKLKLDPAALKNVSVTYHDPCYLGRANDIYDEPRSILKNLTGSFTEMDRSLSFSLCCGAGGAQMFKEAEKGEKEIFIERTEDALKTGASVIASACPFCMTMLTDGLKYKNREEDIRNLDIAELVAQSLGL
jgi:Fe-S oxidoreductase